jgi:hypothetical protein
MSKFILNHLLQISKAFVNSKIQFLFRKEFFLRFRPNRPSGQPARPASQPSQPPALPLFSRRPRARLAHPGLRDIGVLAKIRLLFTFAQPGDDVFSLCHRQAGPTCQFHLPPHTGRPRPRHRFSRPPSATPPRPRDAESRS